jgi:plastocyanin
MARTHLRKWLVCCVSVASGLLYAQSNSSPNPLGELRLRVVSLQSAKNHPAPAVIWLEPIGATAALSFRPHGRYTLLQKNRTFIPHLQVIPVGASVQFPNADPFFHNVFSLFDGKRFDLGLYEAGSSKSVLFSREGVSYIFCNIHPEMSAVVLALSTPLYAIADPNDAFVLPNIPPGDYILHVWVEGLPQTIADRLTQHLHLTGQNVDLGLVTISASGASDTHSNKYGNPYDPIPKSPYDH